MVAETDLDFYARRREQELRMAEAATSSEAASAHRALALIYGEEVRRLLPRDQRLQLIVSDAATVRRHDG